MPLGKLQSAFSLLNAIGNWLPVITLILLAVGIYVAKDHRRALLGAGLGLAAGMLALGLGIAPVRMLYLNARPAGRADAGCCSFVLRHPRAIPPARAAYGAGLWPHRRAGGLLTGRSITAGPDSGWLELRGIAWLRGGAEKAGFRTGPVGAWVYRYKRVLQFSGFGIAALVLVFGISRPGK